MNRQPPGQKVSTAKSAGDSHAVPLTQRETAVLRLIAEGLTAAEAANALGVSTSTVRTHIRRIYGKTGLRTLAGTVGWAYRSGVLGVNP